MAGFTKEDRRPKVMVVDDDESVRDSLHLIFDDRYNIATCSSGVEAIKLMEPTVHVVILDIRLNGHDGFWTYSEIRSQYVDTPILFYTAFQNLKDPYDVINDYRPFAFLAKDGDLAKIQRIVEEAVKMSAVKFELNRHRISTERLATVGTLAAATAHEINNPLSFVIGNLEYLEKKLESKDKKNTKVFKAIKHSLAGSWRIAEIVQSLQTYGRNSSAQSRHSDLGEAIELSVKMADVEIRNRARLVTKYESLEPVACEQGALTQILINLLVNAAHALPVGKASNNIIELQTRRDSSTEEMIIKISDTGSGVEEDIQDRVFEPLLHDSSI